MNKLSTTETGPEAVPVQKRGTITESHKRAMSTSTMNMTPSTNARISIIAIYLLI